MAHGARHVDLTQENVRLDGGGPVIAFGLIGVLGLAAGTYFGMQAGWSVFFRSYLLNFTYVLTLALGALFFVMLQHLTRAGWSVSLRRLAEFVALTMPFLAILFVPMVVPVWTGMTDVYVWADAARLAQDPLLQHKQVWLNPPFWIIRIAVYFVIWSVLAVWLYRSSVRQDASGDPQLTIRMDRWSALGMLLFALSLTFFAIDALMSLNPHWFSTIWGVYIFSGAAVGFFSLLAILVYFLQGSGRLRHAVTAEHYHDVGKLAFGFVVFWAYIAFSQYMLIWYANLPEETAWFAPRQGDAWWVNVSLLLLFGHFVAPFLALLSRVPKRRKGLLVVAAAWLLLMHWLDLYYIVIPRPHGGERAASLAPLHASDIALFFGLGGLFLAAVVWNMKQAALIPQRDPRLHESLAFENI